MKFSRAFLFLSVIAATACTGSEDVTPPGSGGQSGSGGMIGGSGGATGGGSGGGSGGMVGGGTGGVIGGGTGGSGTGGARSDGGGGSAADAGTDAAADGGADGPLSFATDIAYELFFSCGGCHLAPTISGGFDMKIAKSDAPGPMAYPAVTGAVTAAHSGCTSLDASKKRIVAGKPNNSLLYIKISVASPPANCGAHMPMGASLTQPQIDKIRTWIMQGALP